LRITPMRFPGRDRASSSTRAMVNARLARTLVSILGGSLLWACGGGGGGGGSPVTFSFATSSATLAEDDAPASLQVVLHTTLAATTEVASVDVADLGTGTAVVGSDYALFPTQTLTFPIGSLDGDSQTVALTPIDDSVVDGFDETVRLRLQNTVEAGLSGTTQLTATLTDVNSASVAFATSNASTPDEAGGAQVVALELECGAGVTLGVAVSVRVSDLRTGTAVPPGDYATFSARTVTFPVGSADGALQVVSLTVVDDVTTETPETVELGLSSPSVTCTLGGNTTHVLTITDDDALLDSAFSASEGATGTENGLSYDESIDLGSETVDGGPNAGTLLRVTNAGGQPMTLGTPHVAGNHDEDFAIELESSSLTGAGSGASLAAGLVAGDVASPLVAVAGDSGPGVVLRIDAVRLAALNGLQQVALHDLELPGVGPVTLELTRRPLPLAPDARLVVDGQDVPGGPRALLGDLQLWSGVVSGMPGSRVFLALGADGAQGFAELPLANDRLVHVVADGPGQVRLVREPELEALGLVAPTDFCAGEVPVPGHVMELALGQDPPSTSALTVADCRLALETDYQLFQKFGSSTQLGNYVVSLVAAVSEQYRTDVQTTLSIAYLGVHTGSNDGWTTPDGPGTASEMLDEFRTDWGTGWATQADLAHFLSGASLGGGVAYVGALCNASFGFGVSGSLNATIDWGAWTGQPAGFTWDFVVVAHELGHNFGSSHTHSYCPPLDQCYSNCNGTTVCTPGTLMSYCHTCGGMGNIQLFFHPVCADFMREEVNASCLDAALVGAGEFVQYRLRFNPLTTTGNRSATLDFTHDASNVTQPFRVQLTGQAQ
jgi:metallopeptidase family M12-like protein/Calx-beta domain-containing protein